MSFPIPELTLQKDLLRFRFGVFFFAAGVIPNPLDVRFQKVSGLKTKVTTSAHAEGGQNLYTQQLPGSVEQDHLVLERGMVVGSLLNSELDATFSLFKFAPANVMVTLFNESMIPVSAWFFMKTFPVSWATSDLDASEKSLAIDTLKLAYSRMQILRI